MTDLIAAIFIILFLNALADTAARRYPWAEKWAQIKKGLKRG